MRAFINTNFLALLLLLIISIFALKDLTEPGFYTSHDGETHTARIAQYYQALKDGQFPPRFASSFYNGLGSPIFVYIYPLPYALGSLVHFLGPSFSNTFKILMALGFFFSGIFAYIWLKELFKNKQAATIGAVFYILAPYKLQLIYVRGSISELLAYTFLPLFLFFLIKASKSNAKRWISLSAISFAMVLLSQNLVAYLALPFIALYCLILSFSSRTQKFWIKVALILLWSFLISAFTYLPALFERNYVRFDETIRYAFDSHFVSIKQLVRSPWGYGFDLSGTANDMMSFQIGLAHLTILSACTLYLLYRFTKKPRSLFSIKKPFLQNYSAIFILILIILGLVLLMLDTSITKFVWVNFKPLQIIDIPWRIIGLIVIIISIVSSFFVTKNKSGLVFILLIFALIYANRNHVRINKSLFYDDNFFLNYRGTATQYSEFTPKTRQSTAVPEFLKNDSSINTVSGWAKFQDVKDNSLGVNFKLTVISEVAEIRVNKFYFPNLDVQIDGKTIDKNLLKSYTQSKTRLDNTQDTSGFIYLLVNKGNHIVDIKYIETPLRTIANLISLFAISLAVLAAIKKPSKLINDEV